MSMTESAKGKVCQLRLEGCIPGTDTTVFAHLNGGGMGLKNKVNGFHFGFYSCYSCHLIYDGAKEVNPPYEREWLELQALRAVISTQRIMAREGIILHK